MRFLLILLAFLAVPAMARAQDALPQAPDPLQTMVKQGAQLRYMGKTHGFDSWITVFQGQEQYYYVLPDRSAFVMGILYDAEGKAVTLKQLRDLQAQGDKTLDMLAMAEPDENTTLVPPVQVEQNPFEFKTPAEKMFADIQTSNWIVLGKKGAPVIYAFIDPQCPHCHELLMTLKEDYIEAGLLQVRAIPVGFNSESLAQAAFLLAAPDAQTRLFNHLEGDESALPADNSLNNQGIQRNLAVMQSWKFDVTPMTIYQGANGEIKLVRGVIKDIPSLIADIE